MSAGETWISRRAGALHGEPAIPGDKSISHRAIMLGAIAEGISRVDGFLEGEDTRATARIFAELGVRIDAPAPSRRIVHGVGLRGLSAPKRPLDCGNAGTAMRLLAGLLAGQSFDCELVGDASLTRRPMRRVIEPLARMGADISARDGDVPPLRIRGALLNGIAYTPPVASAQVKSAVLLAGLYANGETDLREISPTRDYTERMLAAYGVPIAYSPGRATLRGGAPLRATDIAVPADFSSAAFFIVAATLVPGSELTLRGVGLNPRRTGLLAVLRAMGADIEQANAREEGGEAVADLVVRHAALRGIDVPVEHVADMIDEFPVLCIAAACAHGTTTIRGAAELRIKESDRIAAMAEGLSALGIRITETPDGAIIEGGTIGGGSVDSRGDHRVAMSFVVAGAVARDAVVIGDCGNVATSFPNFVCTAEQTGLDLSARLDKRAL